MKELVEKKEQLIRLTAEFCESKLDPEHQELTEKLIQKLFKQTAIPFESNETKQWAAAIIHAIGSANLLFDDSFEPFISEQELNEYFETDSEETFRHSNFINEQLNLDIFDKTKHRNKSNESSPLKDRVSIDGIYIPLDLFSSRLRRRIEEIQSYGYRVEFRSDEV